MNVCVLMNRREKRDAMVAELVGRGHVVRAHGNATDAYDDLMERAFDGLVIGWKVYPGFACPDPSIEILERMILGMGQTENIGYWQVAVRLLEAIRVPSCANYSTPIVISKPPVDCYYGADFDFSLEIVQRDIRNKMPIVMVDGESPQVMADGLAAATGD